MLMVGAFEMSKALKRGFILAFAAALGMLAPCVVRAGFTSSGTIGSGDVGKTLKSGTVYVVPKSVTLTRTTPYTALYVEDNATTVLYIPYGVTLTVNGGDASGTAGAGAGIRLNEGSTLVITGEGTLNVTGGNAAAAQLLRVRAGETLPLADGDDALLPADEVSISTRDDGTAVVIVPRTSAAARFFRVEGCSP